jgi:HEAT repeat protein
MGDQLVALNGVNTMTRSTPIDHTTGQEPQLGGSDAAPILSGFEPILGGERRAGADVERVQAIINAAGESDILTALDFVERMGQAELYAQELARVVPKRARQTVGGWHGSFSPGQRQNAIAALAVIGSYESIVPLIEALADDHAAVRVDAGDALAKVCKRLDPSDKRTKIAFRALVDALRGLPLSGRKTVASILAASPPDLVLGSLLNHGLVAKEWWARRESAWALGALGDRRATKRLIYALIDSSSAVRTSAAWALGQLDAPVAIEPLAETLDDPDEVVRAAAVEALGAQANRLDLTDDTFDMVISLIAGSLYDEDISVKHAALEALTRINAPQAREALRVYSAR